MRTRDVAGGRPLGAARWVGAGGLWGGVVLAVLRGAQGGGAKLLGDPGDSAEGGGPSVFRAPSPARAAPSRGQRRGARGHPGALGREGVPPLPRAARRRGAK